MLIPSLTSPRPKLIPVPATSAPKSNLGLILKERSFMDRGPMLIFTIVDFFLVLGTTSGSGGTEDDSADDGDEGFVVSVVLEGADVSVGVCSEGSVFIVWYLFVFVLNSEYQTSEGPDDG